MIITDAVIIALIAYAGYLGAKRGLILVILELVSFVAATVAAYLAYDNLGGWVKATAHATASLSNVAAFALIWVSVEILCAIGIRIYVLPRLEHRMRASRWQQIGGGSLNAIKALAITVVMLIIFAGLPIPTGIKQFVTQSYVAKFLLSKSGQLQVTLNGGIGRDLGESLNFFTVTAEPESNERIDLGFTTTGPVDARAEDAMLVLVNRERTSRGLKPLAMNNRARLVARTYSTDMFGRGYFSHINPEGKNPFDRMRAGNVVFEVAGENLALAPTLQLAHDGLMNSPGHRANILNPEYTTVGIGIIDGGPYGVMVAQNFTD